MKQEKDRPMKLGIDIGGVVITKKPYGPDKDTAFDGTHYLDTPMVEGAFSTIKNLVDDIFWNNAWVISKCYENTQKKTRKWLEHNKFFAKTGMDRSKVIYCYERPDKAILCEGLGISHFIDDNIEVLTHMVGIVPNLFLFGVQETEIPHWCKYVPTWADVRNEFFTVLY